MTSERLGNTDLLSVERYELRNIFRWFYWWIWQSTWQSKDFVTLRWWWYNSNGVSSRICVRIVWICLGVELVRSTQGWNVSFWGLEENSVWTLKWTTLVGIFGKIIFTPAVTSYYQVHALNADAHLSSALLCYFRCSWCRNLTGINCILHWIALTLSTLQMGITLVTVVA